MTLSIAPTTQRISLPKQSVTALAAYNATRPILFTSAYKTQNEALIAPRRHVLAALALGGLSLLGVTPAALGQGAPAAERKPLVPTDKKLFQKVALKNAEDIKLVPQERRPAAIKAEFDDLLTRKTLNNDQLATAKFLFAGEWRNRRMDPPEMLQAARVNAMRIIPEPELRAALLSTIGTSAQIACNAVLGGVNQTLAPYDGIYYDNLRDSELIIPVFNEGDGKLSIRVSPRLKGQPVALVGALLAGTIIAFQDNKGSRNEEVLATAIKTRTWAEQLLADKRLVSKPGLAAESNTNLLAMMNSGDVPGGLLEAANPAQDFCLFPKGDKTLKSFDSYHYGKNDQARRNEATPGNPTLRAYLKILEGKTLTASLNDPTLPNPQTWKPVDNALLASLDKIIFKLPAPKVTELKATLGLQ